MKTSRVHFHLVRGEVQNCHTSKGTKSFAKKYNGFWFCVHGDQKEMARDFVIRIIVNMIYPHIFLGFLKNFFIFVLGQKCRH